MLLAMMLVAPPDANAGQPVYFKYGNCGNQIERTITLNKSAVIVDDDSEIPAPFEDEIENIPIKIYPNPTHGRMTVELQNVNNEKITIVVYDLKGSAVVTIKDAIDINVVDISNCKNGIYLMNIILGEQKQTWKIIKN